MRFKLIILLTFFISLVNAQSKKQIEVLTLGTFHFNFPNLDMLKTEDSDKFDVLKPKYQKEIEDIVNRIAKFKPTIIAIERDPSNQRKYDSLYHLYLSGKYNLGRSEDEQIGFRLAKKMNLKLLYCVDNWGRSYEDVTNVLEGQDSIEYIKLENYYLKLADSINKNAQKPIYKTKGIKAQLIHMNKNDEIKKDLGFYLTHIFKYESKDNPYFGVDFETGRWFNRNLRIFRNIQKIDTKPTDRILVIYGSGHMNLLNLFFDASPEYKLLHVNDYLK